MAEPHLPLRWHVPRFRNPRVVRAFALLAALVGGGLGSLPLVLSPSSAAGSPLLFGAPLLAATLAWAFGGAYAGGSENEIADRLARSNAFPFPAAFRLSDAEIFWTEVSTVDRYPERYMLFPSNWSFELRPVALDLPLDPVLRQCVVREIEARTAHARHNP